MMPHPLSEYADRRIVRSWTPYEHARLERRFWFNILGWMVQRTDIFPIRGLGLKLAAYEMVMDDPDLEMIKERELITRHDVKARIEVFNEQATKWYREQVAPNSEPLEMIHLGMTSADVVDNLSLIKIRNSVHRLREIRNSYHFGLILDGLPFRGIKGPVGTQQDMIDLLGSRELADQLDRDLADMYRFPSVMGSVGQVYPRSLDFYVASAVMTAVAEINPAQPWWTVLRGYLHMIGEYSGDQWNEGDVSTSVIRRVALPGLFMAASAALKGVEP